MSDWKPIESAPEDWPIDLSINGNNVYRGCTKDQEGNLLTKNGGTPLLTLTHWRYHDWMPATEAKPGLLYQAVKDGVFYLCKWNEMDNVFDLCLPDGREIYIDIKYYPDRIKEIKK